ncbi:xanthine dehydrogenase family protein subunit M [Mesorhizobium sp. BAC0120]|uniref:FAD binding domain-containing protein n=1 Tax=Mesorhizobium sp. BAC0120 TaxID=3090670 RepID=UPI00298CCA95|nr:xanthine dehydrogenase family protein subunit M [Mesorhizobium sp. BAC0120]MDW6020338.1 xanthine dehydrogenase family protein subunit M [Mesorhizobium sp. BAC0120]
MYSVNYHRAISVTEAVNRVKGTEGRFLSGGMTLLPAMKTRLSSPSEVVDLAHISELRGVKVANGTVTIGAITTHAEVATDPALKGAVPAVSYLAGHIGDPHVRNKGTIGGSIANNDPAADYPAALLALAATIVTDRREIAADDFFTGLFETALEEAEMVTAVRFGVPDKSGYAKFPNPASRYAITGVFVAQGAGGVRVAVTGAGENGVFRASEIEAALAKNFDPSALDGIKVPSDGLMGDIHASPEYRANLISVMAKRAVAQANG